MIMNQKSANVVIWITFFIFCVSIFLCARSKKIDQVWVDNYLVENGFSSTFVESINRFDSGFSAYFYDLTVPSDKSIEVDARLEIGGRCTDPYLPEKHSKFTLLKKRCSGVSDFTGSAVIYFEKGER